MLPAGIVEYLAISHRCAVGPGVRNAAHAVVADLCVVNRDRAGVLLQVETAPEISGTDQPVDRDVLVVEVEPQSVAVVVVRVPALDGHVVGHPELDARRPAGESHLCSTPVVPGQFGVLDQDSRLLVRAVAVDAVVEEPDIAQGGGSARADAEPTPRRLSGSDVLESKVGTVPAAGHVLLDGAGPTFEDEVADRHVGAAVDL